MTPLGELVEVWGEDLGKGARDWRRRHEKKNRVRRPKCPIKGACRPGESYGRKRFAPINVHPILVQMRAARIAGAVSLVRIEKRLGVGAGTVGRWERGEMVPSLLKFLDWCEALGLSPAVGSPPVTK